MVLKYLFKENYISVSGLHFNVLEKTTDKLMPLLRMCVCVYASICFSQLAPEDHMWGSLCCVRTSMSFGFSLYTLSPATCSHLQWVLTFIKQPFAEYIISVERSYNTQKKLLLGLIMHRLRHNYNSTYNTGVSRFKSYLPF